MEQREQLEQLEQLEKLEQVWQPVRGLLESHEQVGEGEGQQPWCDGLSLVCTTYDHVQRSGGSPSAGADGSGGGRGQDHEEQGR